MQRDPYIVSEESLVAEAAQATFAFRNKLAAATLRLVWRQLSRFVVGAERLRKLRKPAAPRRATSVLPGVLQRTCAFRCRLNAHAQLSSAMACTSAIEEALLRALSCRADALKQQKGCLLPNLGVFRVGPVEGEAKQRIRPAFLLQETRWAP
jgi:hypothetical protein